MMMNLLRRKKGFSCHQVLEVMQAYIDGEVSEDVALNVVTHLEMCKRCSHEVALFRRIQNTIVDQRDIVDPAILERLTSYALELGLVEDHDDDQGDIDPSDPSNN